MKNLLNTLNILKEIDNVIGENDLNEAMIILQDLIGQDDGGICGLYWSNFDDSDLIWLNATEGQRFNHIIEYLKLEESYLNL